MDAHIATRNNRSNRPVAGALALMMHDVRDKYLLLDINLLKLFVLVALASPPTR